MDFFKTIVSPLLAASTAACKVGYSALPISATADVTSLEPVPAEALPSAVFSASPFAANATGAMVSTIITARKADNNLLFMFILLKIIFSGKSGAVSPFLRKICT
ncbi:MAG: hypothetical protein ACLR6L_04310 [Agathobaculum sp.]